MKQNELKTLIKRVLNEYGQTDAVGDFDKGDDNKTNTYLFKKIAPRVVHLTKNLVSCDERSGAFGWQIGGNLDGKQFSVIYATPFWTNDEQIEVEVGFEDGTTKNLPAIPYPKWNWTGDVDNDSRLYVKTVLGYLIAFGKKNLSELENPDKRKPDETDISQANIIANSIWGNVKEVTFRGMPNKVVHFTVELKDGKKEYLSKGENNQWYYGKNGDWEEYSPERLGEMSCTGGVAGYATPFAFTKNKKGSPKGISAAKKYGKIVGEAPRI